MHLKHRSTRLGVRKGGGKQETRQPGSPSGSRAAPPAPRPPEGTRRRRAPARTTCTSFGAERGAAAAAPEPSPVLPRRLPRGCEALSRPARPGARGRPRPGAAGGGRSAGPARLGRAALGSGLFRSCLYFSTRAGRNLWSLPSAGGSQELMEREMRRRAPGDGRGQPGKLAGMSLRRGGEGRKEAGKEGGREAEKRRGGWQSRPRRNGDVPMLRAELGGGRAAGPAVAPRGSSPRLRALPHCSRRPAPLSAEDGTAPGLPAERSRARREHPGTGPGPERGDRGWRRRRAGLRRETRCSGSRCGERGAEEFQLKTSEVKYKGVIRSEILCCLMVTVSGALKGQQKMLACPSGPVVCPQNPRCVAPLLRWNHFWSMVVTSRA
ncbi:uncharacterized protein LOC106629212 [Zonotrichia albicollis]|uniref:uncharacterized protein LOC106629212 n=1 Tax=Zonotrichia albicollis TaxID=44394 RepID=UPI003D80FF7F